MADLNDLIRSTISGGSNQTGQAGNSPDSAALKNIATNGALLNQNISRLIQQLISLKTTWGG